MMTRASGLFLMAVSHLLFAAAAEAQGVSFIARRDFGAGSGPVSVTVGDFDGDGKLDLAVANSDSNNVSVLLGNGDGSFQAAQDFGAGISPRSVAVGDFNGDGSPTWPWPTLVPTTFRCFWAMAMGASRLRRTLAWAALLTPWLWATSMSMAGPTWPWPTLIPTPSRS